MPRASHTCTTPGCTQPVPAGRSRCPHHTTQADKARGTARQRGYSQGHSTFRAAVLRTHPTCACTPDHDTHTGQPCTNISTVADHYPLDRRQLIAKGFNPDDPRHGRGLCSSCHGWHTALHQPGGWNAAGAD